jgi:hypothetical protein
VTTPSQVRLAELVGCLALATDLGMGQPLEHCLRTCLLAVGVGARIGLTGAQLGDAYYITLLRFVGCNAHAHDDATEVGDEVVFRAGAAPILSGEPSEYVRFMLGHLGEGLPRATRAKLRCHPHSERFSASPRRHNLTWGPTAGNGPASASTGMGGVVPRIEEVLMSEPTPVAALAPDSFEPQGDEAEREQRNRDAHRLQSPLWRGSQIARVDRSRRPVLILERPRDPRHPPAKRTRRRRQRSLCQ